MRVVILIATYNEVENVEPLLETIYSAIESGGHEGKVIVIDDDSPDGTGERLDFLQRERYKEKLEVIHRKNERGPGSARRKGFRTSLQFPYDCLIEMDADRSHDPKYLEKFILFSQYYDVVIGSRYVEGGATFGWPLQRKLVSLVANQIYRIILGTKIHDLSGGFKCYRRRVIEALDFENFFSRGYSIGIEMLFRCYQKGFSFLEIPVEFQNRKYGKSKFRWREAWEALRVALALVWKYGRAIRIYDRAR